MRGALTLRYRTHNGLMHVLDAVMVPLEEMNATATPSASSTPTATGTETGTGTGSATSAASSTGAAVATTLGSGSWSWTLWAILGTLVVMLEGAGGGWLLMA